LRNREESRVSTVVGVSPDKNENKKQEEEMRKSMTKKKSIKGEEEPVASPE